MRFCVSVVKGIGFVLLIIVFVCLGGAERPKGHWSEKN